MPTGGHFFGEQHTLERYSTAFYQPMLSNWQNYEAWQEAGGLDATARATRLWKKALEEYVEPAMDAGRARGAGGLCGQAQGRDRERASRESSCCTVRESSRTRFKLTSRSDSPDSACTPQLTETERNS